MLSANQNVVVIKVGIYSYIFSKRKYKITKYFIFLALSKNKALQSLRKGNTTAATAGIVGSKQRSSSPTYWDTDFEGVWEMGRDLIKEFIIKQNKGKNRNRSTSESAAYSMSSSKDMANDKMSSTEFQDKANQINYDNTEKVSSKTSSPILLPVVDISFCCDDDAEHALASFTELTPDCSLQSRPLYQREIVNNKLQKPIMMEQLSTCSSVEEEQLDFAQFKAKFNSSVEALWNDVEPDTEVNNDYYSLIPSAFDYGNKYNMNNTGNAAAASTVAAPFKENLRNFWSNFFNSSNQQQQQEDSHTQQQQTHLFNKSNISSAGNSSKMDESTSNSLSCSGSSNCILNSELANTSDYYSMPSNLDDFDKSVGGVKRDLMAAHNIMATATGDINADNVDNGNNNNTPLGVYFQNSIWSENSNTGAGDTDESFYFKVWNSTKKLNNQLDAMQGKKVRVSTVIVCCMYIFISFFFFFSF